MPTTPVSALLYVFLLIPGVLFLNRLESHRTRRSRSVFRETAIVVFASVVCVAAFLGFYLLLSLPFPVLANAFSNFMGDPGKVSTQHPRLVTAAALLFLVVASFFAWLGGGPWAYRLGTLFLWGKARRVVDASAWNQVLDDGDASEVVVGVQMKSGTWIQGTHLHHSDVEEDIGERALVLQGKIEYRVKGTEQLKYFESFDRIVVQASEIDYLVTFLREPQPDRST